MLLWNISTYLAPPDGSALVLAELLHHLVAQLARDVDALRGWHHRAHLVGDWDRDIDEDDIDVGESTGYVDGLSPLAAHPHTSPLAPRCTPPFLFLYNHLSARFHKPEMEKG